jgi:hypothetical protein
MFTHLRACRQLILWLLDDDYIPRLKTKQEKYLMGFALEYYIYLVLVNGICPYGLIESRTLVVDGFVVSLQHLQQYETFGMLFGGYQGLFVIIPSICKLASRVIEEMETLGSVTVDVQSTSDSLRSRINDWVFPGSQIPENVTEEQRIRMGELYQHALLIFLETTMIGSSTPSDTLKARMQVHVTEILTRAVVHNLGKSQLAPIILWSAVITGSVMTSDTDRWNVTEGWRNTPYATWISFRGAELLETMWRDGDPRGYGPYGLYLTMLKHGINICMA